MKLVSKRFDPRRAALQGLLALALLCLTAHAQGSNHFPPKGPRGEYLRGDFHQHTYYTDGSNTLTDVMAENFLWGLDWWANSEHGGERNRDGNGHFWDDPSYYPTNPILGDLEFSGGHQEMWRWQSLRDYVWPDILTTRALFPEKTIISGLEWNVPGHEHCSTAIHQYGGTATGISEFEFRFDRSDDDTSRIGEPSLLVGLMSKTNDTKADAISAVQWMQAFKDAGLGDAWVVPAHVERAWTYRIEDFRNWMDAGPDVAFGFEGLPGHQTSGDRGFSRNALGGGTYGGAGFFVAKIGGLWDGLLAEGRKYYNFASSDYHAHWTVGGGDFWPGEYQKQYTYIESDTVDKIQAVFDGNRSGNSWYVQGDLIDSLQFSAKSTGEFATMGQTLIVTPGKKVIVQIKIRDPQGPNNCPLDMDNPSLAQIGVAQPLSLPVLHHVDVIAADITGNIPMTDPSNAAATDYGTNAAVVQTFDATQWENSGGEIVMTYQFYPQGDMYIRLRGTNLPANVPFETDPFGNPRADSEANDNLYANLDPAALEAMLFPGTVITTNSKLDEVAEAYADLWFYSNPIFIKMEN